MRTTASSRLLRRALLAGLLLALGGPVAARERPSTEAKAGIDLAREAALTWSTDAVLVYLENDEPLDAAGATTRWGYLFHSPGTRKSRAYSIRDGKILVAETLEMKFEAPPVGTEWIDSGAALAVAEKEAGAEYCKENAGRLSTMLLMRGAFSEGDPDATTWTLVYSSPTAPSLFVVVDAAEGKVRKTWRG